MSKGDKARYALERPVRAFWKAESSLRVRFSAPEITNLMERSEMINHEKTRIVEGYPTVKAHGFLNCWGTAVIAFKYNDVEDTMTVWVYSTQ